VSGARCHKLGKSRYHNEGVESVFVLVAIRLPASLSFTPTTTAHSGTLSFSALQVESNGTVEVEHCQYVDDMDKKAQGVPGLEKVSMDDEEGD